MLEFPIFSLGSMLNYITKFRGNAADSCFICLLFCKDIAGLLISRCLVCANLDLCARLPNFIAQRLFQLIIACTLACVRKTLV